MSVLSAMNPGIIISNGQHSQYSEDVEVSYYSRKYPVALESSPCVEEIQQTITFSVKNSFPDNSSCMIEIFNYSKKTKSLKSDAIIPNPYKIGNLFSKMFLEFLFDWFNETVEENNYSLLLNEEIASKHSILVTSTLDINNSAPSNEIVKTGYERNEGWTNWRESKSLANYSKNLPNGLSDLPSAVEQRISRKNLVSLHFLQKESVCFLSDKSILCEDTKEYSMQNYSAFLRKREETPTTAKMDSNNFLRKPTAKPYKRLLTKPALIKSSMIEHEIMKMAQNLEKDYDITKGFEPLKFNCSPRMSIASRQPAISEIEKLALKQPFSKLILLIMQDNSDSDLKSLEEGLNWVYPQENQTVKKHDYFLFLPNCDQIWSSDNFFNKVPREESSRNDCQRTKKNNKEEDVFSKYCSTTKDGLMDSGTCLDTNFQASQSCRQKSDSRENSSFLANNKGISRDLSSVVSSAKSSSFYDHTKVCYLCKKLILNEFYQLCRFGLLLNCLHSFCYSCVKSYTKSPRLSTDLVKCPECGTQSPGIVPSSCWIEDPSEKTALFQEYKDETELFRYQQQVFFKNYLF